MKNRILAALAVASLLFTGQSVLSQEKSNAPAELKELITKVQAKTREGKRTEADLASELKEFDALLARHKGEKTDDVAQILFMKAQLYLQLLGNSEKGAELINQLKTDFPDTKQAKIADKVLEGIKKQAEAKKVQDALAVGTKFPDFNEKDLTGKPLSVANYKGKVVLIDFWATWCGPCVKDLPSVVEVYNKYHDKGFEIIGISLDREQDKAKLESFLKEKHMTWPQFYDGQYWNNKLSTKYGVNSIPATYLLDGEGKIIGKGENIRGENLDGAVAKALARK